MKDLKPNVHRLTLAQAITRLAYVKFFTSAVLKRWLRRHGGRPQDAIRRFPVAMKRNLDQAGKDTIEFILAGVSAFGKPYRVGRDNTDADEERIPHDFLKSGVYAEPLNDTITADILLDKNYGFPLEGYKFVELDCKEFLAALEPPRSEQHQVEAEEARAKDEEIRELRNERQHLEEITASAKAEDKQKGEELDRMRRDWADDQRELQRRRRDDTRKIREAQKKEQQAREDAQRMQIDLENSQKEKRALREKNILQEGQLVVHEEARTREELLRSQANTQQETPVLEATPQTDTEEPVAVDGSGFPGRPSCKDAILQELNRRGEKGQLADGVTQESKQLREWAVNDPKIKEAVRRGVSIPKQRSIENAIRIDYHRLHAAQSRNHDA